MISDRATTSRQDYRSGHFLSGPPPAVDYNIGGSAGRLTDRVLTPGHARNLRRRVGPEQLSQIDLRPPVDGTDTRRFASVRPANRVRKPRRNFAILRHAIDSANSAEKALIHD